MHISDAPARSIGRNAFAIATNENTLMSIAFLKPSRLVL